MRNLVKHSRQNISSNFMVKEICITVSHLAPNALLCSIENGRTAKFGTSEPPKKAKAGKLKEFI